jgi:hypothetical protein
VLELGPAEQNQALCSNKVDAIIFDAGHPMGRPRRRRWATGPGWCASPARQSERLQCPPGRPVARVIGATETAMQPATVLAVIAAVRHSGRLNGMAESTLPAG